MTAYDHLKRGCDVVVSGLGLVVSAPLQLGIAAGLRLTQGAPVLFRQARPGLDGRIFTLVKFRTMRLEDPEHQSDQERLTRIGTWLRSTSLDELPTLWNVLKGDMSLVGPRPLLPEYLLLYSPEQARRHEVRPGITGLAQVSGRNTVAWDQRFALDVDYVDRRSLSLDVWLLWRTLATVVARTGISAQGEATMSRFTGSHTGAVNRATR